MIKTEYLNAAINRALNALRSKQVKANQDARDALRASLSSLNEARRLFNTGDADGAYWTVVSAHAHLHTARRALAS
jgi:hypothetical protein